jgi:galactokinase
MRVETDPTPPSPVAERFAEAFGRRPGSVARAPGRVNLVGEHTDYHGGLCLPIALPLAAWVAVGPRDDDRVQLRSTAEGADAWEGRAGEQGAGWARYVTAALAAVGHRGGLDVLVDSAVPVGAGLSSSAALICAVATAVSDTAPGDLVDPCVRAESEGVGAPTGGMDQAVSLLARPGHALLLDFTTGERRHVPWRPDRAGLELVVVDTRTRHAHADGGYRDRRVESERAMAAAPGDPDEVGARRRRHVESENARVRRVVAALAADDWADVGTALTESHASLRDDYEVSCAELDLVVDTALAEGAVGARMTGGGFGGCAIALVPGDRRQALLAGVGEAFAYRRWEAPRAWVVDASGPAERSTHTERQAPA